MNEETVFEVGQTVRVKFSLYPYLTAGELCTVIGYEPRCVGPHFTWPAYVQVQAKDGRKSWWHTYRFEVV